MERGKIGGVEGWKGNQDKQDLQDWTRIRQDRMGRMEGEMIGFVKW